MFRDNLVKPVDKSNGLPDWNHALAAIWSSNKSRDWHIYSKETFRRFWDDRNLVSEHSR